MSTPGPAAGSPLPPEIAVSGHDGYLPLAAGLSLYCVTHTPPAGVAQRGTLVFFQAFTEERKASHRTAVRLAGALAQAGMTTHRLDLPGCGESTGRLEQLRWQDWLDSAAEAADALLSATAASTGRYVGGIRIGASVAGLCRPAIDTATTPLTWLALAPVLHGAQYLHQLRTRRAIRSDLTTAAADAAPDAPPVSGLPPLPPGSEEFDGFLLNAEFLQALAAMELPRDLARTTGVVLQAGPAAAVTKEFQPLADLPGSPLRVLAVRQEPVWERGEAVNDRPLIAATLQALNAS